MLHDVMLTDTDLSLQDIVSIKKRFIPAGTSYPMHWHDFYEMEILQSGTIFHSFNNHSETIGAGEAYICSYYDCHAFTTITDTTVFCITFDENAFDPKLHQFLSQNLFELKCHFDERELNEITEKLERMVAEYDIELMFKDLYMLNLVSEIVISIIRKCTNNQKITPPKIIQQVIGYMYANFRSDISVISLAKKFSISPNYLGSLFKKWMHTSIAKYLNSIRIKYATNLLRMTDLSMKEIAFASGYNSVEYFQRCFVNQLKTTPLKYKNININH